MAIVDSILMDHRLGTCEGTGQIPTSWRFMVGCLLTAESINLSFLYHILILVKKKKMNMQPIYMVYKVHTSTTVGV